MKKFIAGLVIGHISTNFLYLYLDGGLDRVKYLVDHLKEHPGDAYSFPEMVRYIVSGNPAEEEMTIAKLWFTRIRRIRLMFEEGYSVKEISERMEISTETIIAMLEPIEGID